VFDTVHTLNGLLRVNGVSVPLISQSENLLIAELPAGFDSFVTVTVESGGHISNAVLAPVAAAAPGVYSADRTGIGPALVLHRDDATLTIGATGVNAGVQVTVGGRYVNIVSTTIGPVPGLPGDVYQITILPLAFTGEIRVISGGASSQAGVVL
jgi:hypothetical protein